MQNTAGRAENIEHSFERNIPAFLCQNRLVFFFVFAYVGTIPETFCYFLKAWSKGKNCTFKKGTTLVLLYLQVSAWSQLFAVNGFIISMLGLVWMGIFSNIFARRFSCSCDY